MKYLLRTLLFLFASLLGTGASAGESKTEQYLNITIETSFDIYNHARKHGLAHSTAHEYRPAWDLDRRDEVCSRTIFRDSSHPGSNPYHRFNENNGGIAMTCSESEDSLFYTVIGGVHNSRDGDAVFWGKGIRFRTPELSGFSVGVGLELNLVYYGFDDAKGYRRVLENLPPNLLTKLGRIPTAESGYMIFPLPILVYQIGYSWGNEYTTGRISFVERNLAGAAQLRGVEVSVRIRKDFL